MNDNLTYLYLHDYVDTNDACDLRVPTVFVPVSAIGLTCKFFKVLRCIIMGINRLNVNEYHVGLLVHCIVLKT